MEKMEWNVFNATEEEVQALWRVVQQALELFDLAEAKPEAAEVQVA
jgi:hypothetical protein